MNNIPIWKQVRLAQSDDVAETLWKVYVEGAVQRAIDKAIITAAGTIVLNDGTDVLAREVADAIRISARNK